MAVLATAEAKTDPVDKIGICHKPGERNQRILNINEEKDGPKHFGHGDHLVSPAICDDIPDNNCDGIPEGQNADDAACASSNGMGYTCESNQCVAPPLPSVRIGDRVWEDENVNGTQDCQDTNMNDIVGDAGDTGPECGNGIANLLVNALSPGVDGVCNTGDESLLSQTMTDLDGFYTFENLIPGTYCVGFTKPADDFCLVDSINLGSPQFTISNQGNDAFDSDADPITGQTGNISLTAGDSELKSDAGIACPSILGDRIWEDDGDGVQNCSDTNGDGIVGDPGDMGPECASGIENINVELVNCGPDGIAGTLDDVITGQNRMTDSMGFYRFGGESSFQLNSGTYYTIVSKPDGTDFATPDVGNDAFDSDCGPDGATMCITLGSGDVDRTTDCGIRVTPP
jgi:hypothetical protein